jgi:hypothetical protein
MRRAALHLIKQLQSIQKDWRFIGAFYGACVFSTLTSHKGAAMNRQFALSAMALQD